MTDGPVAVLGSINMDLVIAVPHLPAAGETVLGGDLIRHHGGKGANQAVAAARAGASVRMIGAVGRDADGDALLAGLVAEGVEVGHVTRAVAASGTALICVAPGGENQIAVSAGANAFAGLNDAEVAVQGAAVFLASLEVPMVAVIVHATAARRAGATVVVNAAPAQPISPDLAATEPILVVNEVELLAVGAGGDVEDALGNLRAAGVETVIVTHGDRGVLVVDRRRRVHLPALPTATVVDTTGAGDAFCGVLAAWLARGESLESAARAGNAAAGLSVRTHGAREGLPRVAEILAALADQPAQDHV